MVPSWDVGAGTNADLVHVAADDAAEPDIGERTDDDVPMMVAFGAMKASGAMRGMTPRNGRRMPPGDVMLLVTLVSSLLQTKQKGAGKAPFRMSPMTGA